MNNIQEHPRHLKSISLVFENVESYDIPPKAIHHMNLDQLNHEMSYYPGAGFNDDETIQDFYLELDAPRLANIHADHYAVDPEEAPNLLKRIIQYQDLAGISLNFTNAPEKYYHLYWGHYGDSTNTAMIMNAIDDKILSISINPNNDQDPYQDLSEDSEFMTKDSQIKHDRDMLYQQLADNWQLMTSKTLEEELDKLFNHLNLQPLKNLVDKITTNGLSNPTISATSTTIRYTKLNHLLISQTGSMSLAHLIDLYHLDSDTIRAIESHYVKPILDQLLAATGVSATIENKDAHFIINLY